MLIPSDFIEKWKSSGGHERGSGQLFIIELCDLLGLPHPHAPSDDTAQNNYVFERAIKRVRPDGSTTTNFLDLYKEGHFVLETKQGVNPRRDKSDLNQPLLANLSDSPSPKPAKGHGVRGTSQWDKALEKAYEQARRYIRDLPTEDAIPPFLIVCDVGYVFEIFADFSGTRGSYAPFPVAGQHRIFLEDLRDEKKRALLKTIFTDPHSLDPSKHAAKVTREVSAVLADLAKSLEADKHDPQIIALFLQRCLFTLFAEDVGLLPEKSFENLLGRLKKNPQAFPTFITNLWKEMATGTEASLVISGEKIKKVPYFNGGLFENPSALPLSGAQITLLLHAATKDWSDVEPAIFGTLLERALDPRDRHKLGAHYTPRSYVDRLVTPTLLDPLREKWDAAKTAAALHHAEAIVAESEADELRAASSEAVSSGNKKKADALAKKIDKAEKKARAEGLAAVQPVTDFHHLLCQTKVLDPACGSGNFLYVAMARMKELEAEVLDLLSEIAPKETLTAEMAGFKVRPDQFLGLEINERATAIAQLVLWIGYFQWHKKATGKADTNDRPLLPKQSTIECRDAVLAYDEKVPLKNDDGTFKTIWDGHSTKPHPVTEKEVPDESRTKPLYEYTNPKRTTWPEADFIVGNPPFLGTSRMRDGLGDGYTEALRLAFKKHKPDSWDFVMFWWHHAAELVQAKKALQFGFITTNSIHQTFNRRCLEAFLNNDKKPLSLTFAIPDHPWIDSVECAAVRIAMTVGKAGRSFGDLIHVVSETESSDDGFQIDLSKSTGIISPKISLGVNLASAIGLKANELLSSQGMKLHGQGFLVDQSKIALLGFKKRNDAQKFIRPFYGPKDLLYSWKRRFALDFDGVQEKELSSLFPECYNHLLLTVKPERDNNRENYRRENWWLFGRRNTKIRNAIEGLEYFIATPRTAKHRVFFRVPAETICESEVVVIGLEDRYQEVVLSSTMHSIWALLQGSVLGPTPRYNNTRCFETFPFPGLPEGELKTRIRDLGERLDAHRKTQQAAHPDLTLTGMYNVLEKLRKEEPLTDKDKTIHDQGLVTLLKQIHDDLDQAVLEAYRGGAFQAPSQESFEALAGHLESAATPLADRLARGDEELEQAILQFLVDLNHERAAEEAQGKIRYLRPEFQDPNHGKKVAQKQQDKLGLDDKATATPAPVIAEKVTWPKTTSDRVLALKNLLQTLPPDPEVLSPALKGNNTPKRRSEIQDLLKTLSLLGQL